MYNAIINYFQPDADPLQIITEDVIYNVIPANPANGVRLLHGAITPATVCQATLKEIRGSETTVTISAGEGYVDLIAYDKDAGLVNSFSANVTIFI